ncbi:DUF4041 domain-containing protein [Brochothrix campestris]|uniref:DUF4041 domain-containing protein n=1 Tax=Brochothrix campestris TaxID=2757 RepID=UPI0038D06192
MSFFSDIKDYMNLKKTITRDKESLESLKHDISKKNDLLGIAEKKLNNKNDLILEIKNEIVAENEMIRKKIIEDAEKKEQDLTAIVDELNVKKIELQKEIVSIGEQIQAESFGFYTPQYNLASSISYKNRLLQLRNKQKLTVKNNEAVVIIHQMLLNNSLSKGQAMTKKQIKFLIRAFNNECEAAINKVRYSNFIQIKKRIIKSFEQLNKMNSYNQIELTEYYLHLKTEELQLAYEYEQKKQEEKEELRAQREVEREEKALQKEIASKRKVLNKEISHFENMINELKEKITTSSTEEERNALTIEIDILQKKVDKYQEEKEDLDYRESNARAGYVYIISNIGSFGNDVVKIGVTRRLEPLERINELSSASVPFKFDVHALIFSYDAYTLESQLHQHFSAHRINKVNNRKEFFKVSIEDIEEVLVSHKNLTIDFEKMAEAQEYRESLIKESTL